MAFGKLIRDFLDIDNDSIGDTWGTLLETTIAQEGR